MTSCYDPAMSGGACVPTTSPALRRLTGNRFAECIADGPTSQRDAKTGEPRCCYGLGAIGEGRPLLIDDARRSAGLRRARAWG